MGIHKFKQFTNTRAAGEYIGSPEDLAKVKNSMEDLPITVYDRVVYLLGSAKNRLPASWIPVDTSGVHKLFSFEGGNS